MSDLYERSHTCMHACVHVRVHRRARACARACACGYYERTGYCAALDYTSITSDSVRRTLCASNLRGAPFDEISTQFRRNFEFSTKFRGFDSSAPVFFSKSRGVTWHMPGLRGLPGSPARMRDGNRPAHPAGMGHGPESANGAGVAGAHPAAGCGPERGCCAMCTGAVHLRAREYAN